MAYDATKLNQIGASTGEAKIWIYTDTDTAIADLDADNYYAGSQAYGVTLGDIIFMVGSDGVGFGYFEATPTDSASLIGSLTDAAH